MRGTSNGALVGVIGGLVLAGACSVTLSDELKYRCSTDADCGGDGYVCATAGAAAWCCLPEGAESCDGLDNDCDGDADEDFNLQSDAAHCGVCGKACGVNEACIFGVCVVGAVNCVAGATPCAPAACEGRTCGDGCLCRGGAKTEQRCTDTQDNDGDGAADCADPDCGGQGCGNGCVCKAGQKSEARCEDGVDHDGDQKVGCDDEDCVGKACGGPLGSLGCECAAVGVRKETNCSLASADEDADGQSNCGDTDCASQVCQTGTNLEYRCNAGNCDCNGGAPVPENSDTSCRDGVDNDCDGARDCADTACAGRACDPSGITACQCVGGVRKEMACADGADNDGDSTTDCGDTDCEGQSCGGGTCSGGRCT